MVLIMKATPVDILIGLAIGIGILMLVVVVMADLTDDVQDQFLGTGTQAVTNEQHTISNISAISMTNARCVSTSFTIYNATNSTQVYTSGNYSISCTTAASTVTWLTGTANNSAANFSYSYNYDIQTAAWNISTDGLDAFQTFGDFFNVYVLVGILIGIIALFTMIGYRRKAGGFA